MAEEALWCSVATFDTADFRTVPTTSGIDPAAPQSLFRLTILSSIRTSSYAPVFDRLIVLHCCGRVDPGARGRPGVSSNRRTLDVAPGVQSSYAVI